MLKTQWPRGIWLFDLGTWMVKSTVKSKWLVNYCTYSSSCFFSRQCPQSNFLENILTKINIKKKSYNSTIKTTMKHENIRTKVFQKKSSANPFFLKILLQKRYFHITTQSKQLMTLYKRVDHHFAPVLCKIIDLLIGHKQERMRRTLVLLLRIGLPGFTLHVCTLMNYCWLSASLTYIFQNYVLGV